jgi:hypothetical protein
MPATRHAHPYGICICYAIDVPRRGSGVRSVHRGICGAPVDPASTGCVEMPPRGTRNRISAMQQKPWGGVRQGLTSRGVDAPRLGIEWSRDDAFSTLDRRLRKGDGDLRGGASHLDLKDRGCSQKRLAVMRRAFARGAANDAPIRTPPPGFQVRPESRPPPDQARPTMPNHRRAPSNPRRPRRHVEPFELRLRQTDPWSPSEVHMKWTTLRAGWRSCTSGLVTRRRPLTRTSWLRGTQVASQK